MSKAPARKITPSDTDYHNLALGISHLVEQARLKAAQSVNAIMTATYWEVGRRIVEHEQGGRERAQYGEALLEHLSAELSRRFGRGFSIRNLRQMREFYLSYPPTKIRQTVSAELESRNRRGEKPPLKNLMQALPLSWSHYTLLLSVKERNARDFYETEALRGGWSVRQLDRQIDSQFYERTALSRNKAAMLTKGAQTKPEDRMTPEEQIKNPYFLEFLGLKDEYSESELEEALILRLESFLLELGGDFAFVARQKRLRVGDAWYRVDMVFYHRRLRCLVLIDLKIGKFTHADAGQMHLYLNYAREHWTHAEENPPVGLILCSKKDEAVAHYALEGLPSKILAAEYRTTLPTEKKLVEELRRTQAALDHQITKSLKSGKE